MMVMATPTVIASGTSAEGLFRSQVTHARLRGRGIRRAPPESCPLVTVALCNNCSRLPYVGFRYIRCAGPLVTACGKERQNDR